MSGLPSRKVRCAIYTRKSSDEGLDQDFNSLDAQHEACAAYIRSQTSEGWIALPDRYDDGGISGGTLERPALKRLLADVAAGRVDVIVVYKVDRLSRSLFDFAKLVEQLEAGSCSFVSITQPISTTTSMGRLTLNMLLSFAQFEREVTAERIRDKIAASKAKGMWMGGVPPLGYRGEGRSLAIVEEHAVLIRRIFALYLEHGTVRLLDRQLQREGLKAPKRTLGKGMIVGGIYLSRGQLYDILSNRIYLGEIVHRDQVYPGLHEAIIDRDIFDAVQARMTANAHGNRTRPHAASPSLLAGKVVDEGGAPLVAHHATNGTTRYRYYVSRDLQHGITKRGYRLPASLVEQPVAERLATALADSVGLLVDARLDTNDHQHLHERVAEICALPRGERVSLLLETVDQVQVGHWLRYSLQSAAARYIAADPGTK